MMEAVIVIIIGFCAGFFTRSNGWRAAWSCIFFGVAFFSAVQSWSRFDPYTPGISTLYKEDLTTVAIAVGVFLVGLAIGVISRPYYDDQKLQDTKRRLSNTTNTEFVKWIDNTIIDGRLHNDPWVEKIWMPLSQEKKTELVASHRRQFLDFHTRMFAGNQLVPYPRIIAMVERAFSGEGEPEQPPDEPSAPQSAPDLDNFRTQVNQIVGEVRARGTAALERAAEIVKREPSPPVSGATATNHSEQTTYRSDAVQDQAHVVPPMSNITYDNSNGLSVSQQIAIVIVGLMIMGAFVIVVMSWQQSAHSPLASVSTAVPSSQPAPELPAHVVRNPDGTLQPAPGYDWVDSSTGREDLRVRPISAFEQGLAARTDWEHWLASLSGDSKKGAYWWSGQRSLPNPGACNGTAASSRQFIAACEAAKARLVPSDMKRKSDPEYRNGWNSF